jgi:predicted transcriptional regulator
MDALAKAKEKFINWIVDQALEKASEETSVWQSDSDSGYTYLSPYGEVIYDEKVDEAIAEWNMAITMFNGALEYYENNAEIKEQYNSAIGYAWAYIDNSFLDHADILADYIADAMEASHEPT